MEWCTKCVCALRFYNLSERVREKTKRNISIASAVCVSFRFLWKVKIEAILSFPYGIQKNTVIEMNGEQSEVISDQER